MKDGKDSIPMFVQQMWAQISECIKLLDFKN